MTTATTKRNTTTARERRADWNARRKADEYMERAERLALNSARAAEAPGARTAYAERFRMRLLEDADRLDDLDPHVFGRAFSRAAVALAERTGLHPKDAEAVRLDVQAEERSRLGLERPGALALTPWGDLVEATAGEERDDEDDRRVPGRGRARADRVRRGGPRR
ncbi:hypothetical protein GCM10009737_10040 [Nocardioides lentus]|uniref:DUF222 domain-containing protein n=1 Tax=Nocardioides lentus TaxID=338077 RepID=A0ABN2P2A8_9ACTN